MSDARVATDSLSGNDGHSRVAIPVADIKRVDTHRLSALRTAAAVGGALWGAFAVYALLLVDIVVIVILVASPTVVRRVNVNAVLTLMEVKQVLKGVVVPFRTT